MKIITTHLHADFDCLASMVAAKKLYPDATLVFPGSQEKNVRDYLAQSDFHVPYRKLKGFDLDEVSQIIIVDASTRERVGVFAELADKDGVETHLYDHHPSGSVDIPHTKAVIRDRGSTVTIFAELFMEQGITLSSQEATLLAIGLYEDTGSLTFSSVGEKDFAAGAWLLSQGADLNEISIRIMAELSVGQVQMLNSLINNLQYINPSGLMVAITTGSTSRYMGDLSTLVHKLMDMEHPSALFTFVRMADRIHLIARSRVEAVDTGVIARSFGGGGHPSAASATIKDMTLLQSVEKLKGALAEMIEPVVTAGDMMVEHVLKTEANTTIAETESAMTKFDVGSMPVVDDGELVGIVTRQIIEKVIFHKMSKKPVSHFMALEFETVHPDSPVSEVESLILGRRQKMVPVVDPGTGELVGVITRGMALNKLYGDSLKKPHLTDGPNRFRHNPLKKNVGALMRDMLPAKIKDALNIVAQVADDSGYTAYVVGGFVRDLLVRTPNSDVDIVIEGDGLLFAKSLAERVGGRSHPHNKFKTSVVTMPDGFKLDVATARVEYYSHPAALPVVEMSAIRNDLYRRDFSINAMAIRLNGKGAYILHDFFNGQADLKEHAIRVLHNLSFVEDPTRVFRAVRFERRLGFALGKQTLSLLKNAVRGSLFNRLSGERLFNEIVLILQERRPAGAMMRMRDLDLLKFLHYKLGFNASSEKVMDRCEETLAWYEISFPERSARRWVVMMMALFDGLDKEYRDEMMDMFDSAGRILKHPMKNLEMVEGARLILNKSGGAPSAVGEAFSNLTDEALLFLAARISGDHGEKLVTNYLTNIQDIKPFLSGEDILGLGVKPSPQVASILKQVMAAQLDGKLKSRQEALEFASGLSREGVN